MLVAMSLSAWQWNRLHKTRSCSLRAVRRMRRQRVHGGLDSDQGPGHGPKQREPITEREQAMAESVYKVIELVGTSTESWEKAAAAAVATAGKSIRDLRIAEVVQMDLQIQEGNVVNYRAKVKLSFKYQP